MKSNGSRWGVKGSSEVSEGLTAVYRYEAALDLSSASLGEKGAGRLSSVGLSGGFGTVTLGQIYSASYNHVGALTDNGVWSGNRNSLTLRTPSNLSYSASTGPISFQLDAGMDDGKDNVGTGRSLDRAELGLSFDTGAANVGMAFTSNKNAEQKVRTSAFGVSVPVGGLTLAGSWMEIKTTTFATKKMDAVRGNPALCIKKRWENAKIDKDSGKVVVHDATKPDKPLKELKDLIKYVPLTIIEDITSKNVGKYGTCDSMVRSPSTYVDSEGTAHENVVIESIFQKAVAPKLEVPAMPEKTGKTKQMRFSVTGPLGDTGMSFAVNVHNNPDKKGVGENPWNAHVSKSLGGGARLAFEYIDNDDDVNEGKKLANEALVHLQVDF